MIRVEPRWLPPVPPLFAMGWGSVGPTKDMRPPSLLDVDKAATNIQGDTYADRPNDPLYNLKLLPIR